MSRATLAFDLGGTKLAAALVDGTAIIEHQTMPTRRNAGPGGWVDDMTTVAQGWHDRFDTIGVAVTGQMNDGCWSALNRETLDIGEHFPLVAKLQERLNARVYALNDAQAAAWGEYRYGAGQSQDMVFVTVSTGVGAGLVLDGRLVTGRAGLAGHVGLIPVENMPLEDTIGGRSIAAAAVRAGHSVDARAVFDAATNGSGWAEVIIANSARHAAQLCETLQAVLDPQAIVIGGGIGLADGYLDRVAHSLSPCSSSLRPTLVHAALGADAGLLGVADLARMPWK